MVGTKPGKELPPFFGGTQPTQPFSVTRGTLRLEENIYSLKSEKVKLSLNYRITSKVTLATVSLKGTLPSSLWNVGKGCDTKLT